MTLEMIYLGAVGCLAVALSINSYRVWRLRKQMETVIHNMNMVGMVLMSKHFEHEKEHTHV